MNPSTRYIAVRNYTEIFDNTLPSDRLTFIRQYATDLLILRLSKINAILFQEPEIPLQTMNGLDVLFPGMDASPLLKMRNFETSAYFSSASISMLIKACLENFVETADNYPVHPSEIGIDLLKTILIFNETYFRTDPNWEFDSFESIFKLDLQQQAYIRSNVYQKMFTMVKFAFAAKYVSDATDLRKECIEFCEYYGISSPWYFGKFFMSILEAILPKEQVGKHVLNFEGVPSKFISEFTITRDNLREHKPFSVNMDIVPKPFYLIGNDAVILDFDFFQYHIDQGFFYLLYKNTSLKKGKRFNSYNAYQGHIGLYYFEQFLVKKYLSAIFYRRSQKIVSTEKFQDFIIKPSNNNVLVVEVKNATFHANTLEQMDFKNFVSTIDQNFLASKAGNSKNKGFLQILKQIDFLVSEDPDLRQQLEIRSTAKMNIYPVILYSDPNFDISGVNEYVNKNFEAAINDKRHLVQSIRPITLINVNTFVKYFAHLKQKPSRLTDLIADYFVYIHKNKKKYTRDKHSQDHYLSNISFDGYLKRKLDGNQWERNLPEMKKDFDLNIPAMHELTSTDQREFPADRLGTTE
ncbi:hypothetical protein [Dyadobacter sp. 3J3]|uniref:hypothetical protein n=1 Tax=Dyadobacter sp. 3J3 TaxID=2606600 RepID=UPI001356AB6D|nr:hypothetical protein [Dyadobacter sp. 3J3]